MQQYQIVLTLGIILILLIMLDTYRRIRRKRYHSPIQPIPDYQDNDKQEHVISESIDNRDYEASVNQQTSTFSFNETFSPSGNLSEPEAYEASTDDLATLEDEASDSFEQEEETEEVTPIQSENDNPQDQEQTSWEKALKMAREKRFRHPLDEPHQSPEFQSSFDLGEKEELNLNQSIQKETHTTETEDDFLIFHIMAPRGYVFYGEDLEAIFNLRSYHRSVHNTYEFFGHDYELLFTVINLNEPKTFGQIHEIQTSGVTIYADIRRLKAPYDVFRDILSEAHQLAESLGGTLTNDQKRRFTQSDFSRYMAKVKQAQNQR